MVDTDQHCQQGNGFAIDSICSEMDSSLFGSRAIWSLDDHRKFLSMLTFLDLGLETLSLTMLQMSPYTMICHVCDASSAVG
jgi:hypothetical protein